MIADPPQRLGNVSANRNKGTVAAAFFILLFFCNTYSAWGGSAILAWNPDSGSGIAEYRLYQGIASRAYTNSINTGNATNATVSGLVSGVTYYFAVTAIATSGLESQPSSEVTYTPTQTSTTPPTITLTSPADKSTYAAPATMSLAATAVANGHTITEVRFFNGGTLLGEDIAAPYTLTWSNVSAGTYSVSAALVFDATNTLTTTPVSVSVAAPPPSNGASFAADSGNISAPFVVNNGILYQNTGTSVTDGGRAVYSFTVTTTGDYVINALACGTNGAANSFYVNIDAEPFDPTMIWDLAVSSGFINTLVTWRGSGTPENDQFQPKVFNLSAGTHQLIVRGREPYAQVKSFTIAPANTLPAPWQAIDIGSPGLTGSSSVSNDQSTVSGAGNIYGGADNFRFVYQNMTDDGEIVAQIESVQSTVSTAIMGVMIRENLLPSSQFTLMGYSSSGYFCWQRRQNSGGSTLYTAPDAGAPPQVWVRLVRNGQIFKAFESVDGSNWKQVANWNQSMASNVYFGLAVASGNSDVIATSSFRSLTAIP
jgi:hypothetical protein